MRPLALLSAVLLTGLLSAHMATGQPTLPRGVPQPKPSIKVPPPQLNLPPRITAARLTTPTTGYTTGPIRYEVEVANLNAAPLDEELLFWRSGSPTQPTRLRVQVPPSTRSWVSAEIAAVGVEGCSPIEDKVTLRSKGLRVTITPSCTFRATPIDPEDRLPADQRVAIRQGKLSYHSARVLSTGDPSLQPICGASIVLGATASNDAPITARSVGLRIIGPARSWWLEPSSRFDLASRREQATSLATSRFTGQPGTYKLLIDNLGAPVHQRNWVLEVDRTCSLAFATRPYSTLEDAHEVPP